MRKEDVENLKVKDLKHVLLPLKRGRMLRNYVDIGFDSEYTSEDNSAERTLISIQFSLGKGRNRIFCINKREGISSEELLNYALRFLNEQQVEPKKHVYLIVHFGIAELSKINDFYDEYIKDGYKTRPRVAHFNKAVRWQKSFGDLSLHVIDLYGHMKTSLKKIGEGLGYEKFEIKAEGKNHDYWITHMKELSERHREIYEKYAIRDAEITFRAWNALKQKYAPLNLDPHLYTTFTSLAVASFRRCMTKLPCRVVEERILSKQRMKGGKWREHIAKKLVYDGDLNVRLLAALSYWGGNNQAFARGYFKDIEGTYYDFISLYIIAGIIQPLSNEDTAYKRATLRDVKDGYEGFCEVQFEFPDNHSYPCLQVQENYYPKLMFPLKGTSYCTLAEVRQALKLGVQIKRLRGYGFYPVENEIEHELKPFLSEMLKNKRELEATGKRGSTEYNIEKAKMVGVVGRFAYMKPSHTAEDIAQLLRVSGLQGEQFRRYGKKKAMRALYTRSEVGGSWHIEWATLILGKARSMTASIIPQGEKCLLISTDGGMWLGDPKFEECELHKKITRYHSGIRYEGKFDEIWVARNRLYIAWNKGEVLHSAMMGIAVPGKSSEKRRNFEKMIRDSLEACKEIHHEAETWRLTGLNDYIHDEIPLNSVQRKTKKMSWHFDGKRRLNDDINVFKEHTDTRPYETVEQAYRDVMQVKAVGRPKAITEVIAAELRTSEYQKLTYKQAAEKLDVSVSTIKRERLKLQKR